MISIKKIITICYFYILSKKRLFKLKKLSKNKFDINNKKGKLKLSFKKVIKGKKENDLINK